MPPFQDGYRIRFVLVDSGDLLGQMPFPWLRQLKSGLG